MMLKLIIEFNLIFIHKIKVSKREEDAYQKLNRLSGSILAHQPSLGICEAVLVSVTHSNTAYQDNRLTDDWSGCHTLVNDLTAV